MLSVLVLTTGFPRWAEAQSPTPYNDQELQSVIEEAVRGFKGDVGVFVLHIPSGRSASINPDVVFPSASLIKVAILANAFDRMERGLLSWDAKYAFRDTLRTPGAGILAGFRDGEMVTVGEMLELMISASDNTAALWLQHLSGSGVTVNNWLDDNGYPSTKINAGTPGRQKQWKQYNWGQTTPREISNLLVAISQGRAVSPWASERMYRLMSRSFIDTEGLAMIPPEIQTISKQASIERSRSEVILVNAPHGAYVFAVLTKNIRDISWEEDNESFVMIRNVSAKLWEYFEPYYAWQPAWQHRSQSD